MSLVLMSVVQPQFVIADLHSLDPCLGGEVMNDCSLASLVGYVEAAAAVSM